MSDADFGAVVDLLGAVCGSTVPLVDRRQVLMDGLARLVGADVWAWGIRRGHSATDDLVPLWISDKGMDDPAEREFIFRVFTQPRVGEMLLSKAADPRHNTFAFDLESPDDPLAQALAGMENETSLNRFLVSFFAVNDNVTSGVGLHRRREKPPYSERDIAIVHMILGRISWLHTAGLDMAATTETVLPLSPRLAQTLVYVLGGENRRQIAARMKISEYTVADYLKRLHRHFRVKSRGELLAKFIAGGGDSIGSNLVSDEPIEESSNN